MNNLIIKNLPNTPLPHGLHAKIMRKVVFLKFRLPFTIILTLLFLNLIITIQHIYGRLAESQGHLVLLDMLRDFEFSTVYFGQILSMAKEVLPITTLVTALINTVVLVYILTTSVYINKIINESGIQNISNTH